MQQENLHSTSQYNITSIINAFETNIFMQSFKNLQNSSVDSSTYFSKQLDNLILWLNNDFIPMALTRLNHCSSEELLQCKTKITYIKRRFIQIGKIFKNPNKKLKHTSYRMMCSICKKEISVSSWQNIQDHEHIETALVEYLNNKKCMNEIKPSSNVEEVKFDSWFKQPDIYKDFSQVTTISELKQTIENVISPLNISTEVKELNASENLENNISSELNINEDFKTLSITSKNVNEKLQVVFTKENSVNHMEEISSKEDLQVINDEEEFTFNFEVDYETEIKKVIYPNSIVDKVKYLDCVDYYTVQRRGPECVTCLLCQCEIPFHSSFQAVFQHVLGHRHCSNSKKEKSVSALKAFHDFWMRQDIQYQAHQTHFIPYNTSTTNCLLCCQFVYYKHVIAHIEDDTHKDLVLDLLECKRRSGVFLTNLQITVYRDNEELRDYDETDEVRKEENLPCRSYERMQANIEDSNSDSDSSSSIIFKSSTNESSNNSDQPSPNNTVVNHVSKKPKHCIVKSVLKQGSRNIADLLENRFLPHLKVIKQENSLISCTVCNVSFNFNMNLLHMHILDKKHKMLTGIPIPRYKYQCDICNTIFKSQEKWIEHLQHENHIERSQKLPPSRKDSLIEYECKTCRVVIFGDNLSKKKHESQKEVKREEREVSLTEKARLLLQSEAHIASESTKLVTAATNVLSGYHDVIFCCRRIEAVLSESLGKQCKAYPFGSRVSGLTSDENSDLDVYIDLGEMYNGQNFQDAKSQEKFVKKCSKIFRKRNPEFRDINSIPTARTPIIQVLHVPTNIDCDLSFKNGLSVENTKFLVLCIQLQPVTQPLILLLKEWAKATRIKERITTYAISMMAIFFLQRHMYLLPVTELKEISEYIIKIDGWEAISSPQATAKMLQRVTKYSDSLKKLLMSFFDFYAMFDFENMVVCPLLGKPIAKSLFIEKPNGELLPPAMKVYVEKLQTSEDPEIFRAHSPLCIQDPFDLSHNLTKACNVNTATRLKRLFILSFNHLQQNK